MEHGYYDRGKRSVGPSDPGSLLWQKKAIGRIGVRPANDLFLVNSAISKASNVLFHTFGAVENVKSAE